MQSFCYYRTYNSFAVLCSNNYVLLTFNRTLHVSNLKKTDVLLTGNEMFAYNLLEI